MPDFKITQFESQLSNFISGQIKRYKRNSGELEFFNSQEFKNKIAEIFKQTTKEDLQLKILSLMELLNKKTSIKFNYYHPTIWTNWGLERFRFTGSGGLGTNMSGFSSHPSSSMMDTNDVSKLMEKTFLESYLKENGSILQR